VPFEVLAREGVTLFTDDGTGVQDAMLMRRALVMARKAGVTLAQHCEVASMTSRSVMHEGSCCSHMGVPGWPAEAEEAMVRRDLDLVRETGATMHFLHLSTAGSVELIRAAKKEGLPITAEVTPHHISLRDEMLLGFNPLFKVNPPLRTAADIEALHEGLRDGTVDAVATDHAPHTLEEKKQVYTKAPSGGPLVQHAVVAMFEAHHQGKISVEKIVEKMCHNPAKIFKIEKRGFIKEGFYADLVIVNAGLPWNVKKENIIAKCGWSPFEGYNFKSRISHTFVNGELVYQNFKVKDKKVGKRLLFETEL
jgi:dihydroorotase